MRPDQKGDQTKVSMRADHELKEGTGERRRKDEGGDFSEVQEP